MLFPLPNKLLRYFLLTLSFLLAASASAVQKGDWLTRFGMAHVAPNDSSGTFSGAPTVGVTVDSDTQLFANFTYMLQNNLGLELLVATPFTHRISATGVGEVAEISHLPPTLSLQYHFSPAKSVRPYVGGGINYTTFFSEKTTNPVINSISLDDSWGLAVQAGLDVDLNKDWFFNVDLRYIDIETTATTDTLGSVDVAIDPWVVSAGVGLKF